jgi:hypothetical protein
MENNIIKKEPLLSIETLYEEHIKSSVEQLKKYTDIDISSKILHYLKEPIICYYCSVYKKTNSNPFNINIDFCFEFLDGEIPYATILTDFVEPSLKDNRNYYRCLTKEHKYKFNSKEIKKHQIILESMIKGIGNFLTLLKDSIYIKSFVFFGEYEYNHVYLINDFLMNKNYLNFYRINVLKKNKEEERYILFTKLYFLLLEPLKDDKTLVKIKYQRKLKDMSLYFDKNELKNTLIINFSSTESKENIEFSVINRKSIIDKENTTNRILNNNLSDNNNNEIKEENKNDIKENDNKENKFNYSLLIKEWFTYIDKMDFKTYDLVVNKYEMLFNESRENFNINEGSHSEIEEYKKLIEFYEKLINYYENKKVTKDKINKIIANIIFISAELVNYANNKKKEDNEYLLKVKKYLKYYK